MHFSCRRIFTRLAPSSKPNNKRQSLTEWSRRGFKQSRATTEVVSFWSTHKLHFNSLSNSSQNLHLNEFRHLSLSFWSLKLGQSLTLDSRTFFPLQAHFSLTSRRTACHATSQPPIHALIVKWYVNRKKKKRLNGYEWDRGVDDMKRKGSMRRVKRRRVVKRAFE